MKKSEKPSRQSDGGPLSPFGYIHSASDSAAPIWEAFLPGDYQKMQQTVDSHSEDIRRHEGHIRNANSKYRELTRKIEAEAKAIDLREKKANEQVNKLKGELARDRFRAIEILALFVAFFTFVSVEFQLFATLTRLWQVLSLSITLLGALVFFVVLLGRIIDGPKPRRQSAGLRQTVAEIMFDSKLLILSVVMVLTGIVIMTVYRSSDVADEDFHNYKSNVCITLANDVIAGSGDVRAKSLDSYEKLDCGSR